MSGDGETDEESEVSQESETDDESVAPASSSDDKSDRDNPIGTEDIEEQLNGEDESTPSLHPLRNILLKKTRKNAPMTIL